MASLRLLPLDIFQEIVAYLDMNSLCLLFGTFDARVQRLLVNGAVASLSPLSDSSVHLLPLHRYFLKSLHGIDRLIMYTRGKRPSRMPDFALDDEEDVSMEEEADQVQLLEELSPRHLEWHMNGYLWPEIDYSGLLSAVHTLKIWSSTNASTTRLTASISCLPATLVRFQLYIKDESSGSSLDAKGLINAMPATLVEFRLNVNSHLGHLITIPLRLIYKRLNKLEVLELTGVYCEPEEDSKFELPDSLTSLAVPSAWTLSNVSGLANSNISQLTISSIECSLYEDDECDVNLAEIFLPKSLVRLQLQRKALPWITRLPTSITTLEVEFAGDDALKKLAKLVLPLQLRSLTISIPATADFRPTTHTIHGILPTPASLTYLNLRVGGFTPRAEDVHKIFSAEARSSPSLLIEIELHRATLESIIGLAHLFPRANIKATNLRPTTAEELQSAISRGLTLPVLPEFSPVAILKSISTWLNGSGRLQFSMCLCSRCLTVWNSQYQTVKRFAIPIPAFKGQILACYGAISFVDDVQSSEHNSYTTIHFPPCLEELSFVVPLESSCKRSPTSIAHNIITGWPKPLKDLRLTTIDFGAAPLAPNDALWDALPRTLTSLKSSYELDPLFKFGGRFNHVTYTLPKTRLLHLVELVTPYFVFSFGALKRLVSPDKLVNLSVTIQGEDVELFEFALGRGKIGAHSFPSLDRLELRAIPVVTGMLVCNYQPHITLRMLEQEVFDVFQMLNILVVDCYSSGTFALHPAATHATIDDVHGKAFGQAYGRGGKLNLLREFESSREGGNLQFHPTLTSLDMTVYSIGYYDFQPKLPAQLRHLRLTAGRENRLLSHLPFIPKDDYPTTLESIAVLGTEEPLDSLFYEDPYLPRLALLELSSIGVAALSALCQFLPLKTIVKVETVRCACLLPPFSEQAHFSWKTVFYQCLALEEVFPNLDVSNWRLAEDFEIDSELDSETVTTVSLSLDWRLDSLFEGTTARPCQQRFLPLIKDILELQARDIVPIAIPSSVTSLDLGVSLEIEPFKSYAPSVFLVGNLIDEEFSEEDYPHLKHLTIRLVDQEGISPHSSSYTLNCALLPKGLEVLNIHVTGNNTRTRRTLKLEGYQKRKAPFKINIMDPLLAVTTQSGKPKFKINHVSI